MATVKGKGNTIEPLAPEPKPTRKKFADSDKSVDAELWRMDQEIEEMHKRQRGISQ